MLHRVCSSEYVSEAWISLVSYANRYTFRYGHKYWNGFEATHFALLSALCDLTNTTITDAMYRFEMQSFITRNVLTDSDFVAQTDEAFDQFTKSLVIDFGRVLDIVQLFTQVDQPYTLFDTAEIHPTFRTERADNQTWSLVSA